MALSLFSTAQADRSALEWGLLGGIFVYQGDLAPSRFGSFKTFQPGGELFAEKPLGNLLSIRANLAISRLKGDESRYNEPDYRQERNLSFNSPLIELSGLLVSRVPYRLNEEKKLDPYVFAGIGLAWLNIERDWSRINLNYFTEDHPVWQGLDQDSAYSLRNFFPTIPVGVGAKYAISDRWAIMGQATYRLTFSDYIDGFSEAVNPKQNDYFFSITAGVVYRPGWGKDLKCPTAVGY